MSLPKDINELENRIVSALLEEATAFLKDPIPESFVLVTNFRPEKALKEKNRKVRNRNVLFMVKNNFSKFTKKHI